MNITLEACKPDTYVGCPAPAVTPPTDCEAGYEIGNGTMVCATEEPAQHEPLAATGGDATGVLVAASIALAVVSLGLNLLTLAREHRGRQGRERLVRIERTLDDRGSLER